MPRRLQQKESNKYIAGIDEAGRGPLAGPVFSAAAAIPHGWRPPRTKPLRDSKKLTALQRRWWLDYIENAPEIHFAVSYVTPKVIDRINISQAANLAATRSWEKLVGENRNFKQTKLYLDGGLYISKPHDNAETIVRADETINVVKIASIIAKALRDARMLHYHKKYPEYGFADHKGYGTQAHRDALYHYGPCAIHRRSFLNSKMSRIMNNEE